MERISAHITYSEAIFSSTALRKGLPNMPPKEILATMRITAERVFEPLRSLAGVPLRILSFYRSLAVNRAVGGSATSQHMKGEAIDIQATGKVANSDLFHFIRNSLEYDQVIAEFPVAGEPAWIHVSYTARGKNRKQALVALRRKGKTFYLPFKGNEGLVDP